MHKVICSFPKLFAKLISLRKLPNFEKILYLRNIKKGDVVLDIGANCGYFTVLFSRLVSTYGEVHAFEPVPETFELLLGNTRKMISNIKPNNLAVGDKRGKAVISYNLNDSEKASLVHSCASMKRQAETDVIPLDDYMEENDIRKLDFVKCDVEGFELNALKGMMKTLAIHHPQISLEVTLPNEQKLEMIDLLKRLGYDSFSKIERGFPEYDTKESTQYKEDYFYLHATSSLAT